MQPTRSQFKQLRKFSRFNNWLNQYEIVKLFHQKFGRFPKSKEKFPGNNRLGRWYNDTNRTAYRLGRMKLWQVQLLNKFNYVFEPSDHWEINFNELKKGWKEHPESWPYVYYYTPNLKRLEIWCKRQRQFYEAHKLSFEQISKLNSINFPWEPPGDIYWNNHFNNLVKWVKTHSGMPRRYSSNEKENFLAKWLAKERSKINKHMLNSERVKSIIYFCKKYKYNPYRPKWNESYSRYKKWYQKYGKRPNKRSSNIIEKRLGYWLFNQNIRYSRGQLPKEEANKFAKLKRFIKYPEKKNAV